MTTEMPAARSNALALSEPSTRTGVMQAILQDAYGPPSVLRSAVIERPHARPGEVLVRVRAAGVDRGTWHLLTGLPYVVRLAGYGMRRPKTPIPGTEVAGVVEEVGPQVTEFSVGEEVFGTCTGAFAQYACARVDQLAAKPANLDFEHAAAMPASAQTALQGLRDVGGVEAGQRVLVLGAAGGVGSFATQIAKALGATVTGVCSTAKMEAVRALGADTVLDYTKGDVTRSGERYDVILDTGGNRPLSSLRRALVPHGTLVIVGGERGGRWTGGADRQLRALVLSRFVGHKLRSLISTTRVDDLRQLRELVECGTLTPLVDRTYPLIRVPEAIADLAAGRLRGKAVIRV